MAFLQLLLCYVVSRGKGEGKWENRKKSLQLAALSIYVEDDEDEGRKLRRSEAH